MHNIIFLYGMHAIVHSIGPLIGKYIQYRPLKEKVCPINLSIMTSRDILISEAIIVFIGSVEHTLSQTRNLSRAGVSVS